jgi:hypothetical protein
MKTTCRMTTAILLACNSIALAQQPAVIQPASPLAPATMQRPALITGEQFTSPNLPLPAVTPEVWLYSQEWRRHDDPAQAVRRKAEARTAQRMQRLAAMKWYGFSNSRPQASISPFTSVYSPAWIGNGYHRYDWVGGSYPTTAVIVEGYENRR